MKGATPNEGATTMPRSVEAAALRRLPGGDLITEGIDDLRRGRRSIAALLVAIGARRIRAAGVEVPDAEILDPELRLYELLAADDADSAHGRYNALLRRLTSFERAIERSAENASPS